MENNRSYLVVSQSIAFANSDSPRGDETGPDIDIDCIVSITYST